MKTWEHTRDLPSGVRAWVEDVTGYLAGTYDEATDDSSDVDFGFYKREKESALDEPDINWKVDGSERTVFGLGVTWDGRPMFEDRRRVVLKIQPSASMHSGETTSANGQAIETYDEIIDRGDGDLVAPFIEASPDGTWVAQQYVLPIQPPRGGDNPPTNWIRDPGSARRDEFEERCGQRGLSINTSRGNVGVNRDGETVLLDIGGHTEYQGTHPK